MTKGIRLINKLMKLERKETFNTKRLIHWIEELENSLMLGDRLRCPCLINFVYPSNCFYRVNYYKHDHKFSVRDYCAEKCPRSKIWDKLIKYTKFNFDRKFEVKAYLLEQLKTLL